MKHFISAYTFQKPDSTHKSKYLIDIRSSTDQELFDVQLKNSSIISDFIHFLSKYSTVIIHKCNVIRAERSLISKSYYIPDEIFYF